VSGVFIGTLVLLGFLAGVVIGRQLLFHANMGEALVANAIAAGFRKPHVLLNNVTLQVGTESTQIDHLLIAESGIFVIETKHYKGWIFGHPNDSHWTQVIYRHKSKFQNPLRQNYGHTKAVKSLFTLPDEAFIPVVVFTGEAELKNEFGPGVLKHRQLLDFLSVNRPAIFDERKMAYVVGRIEMKRLRRSLETDEYHLNSLRRRMAKKALA
jgi:restriction system protein